MNGQHGEFGHLPLSADIVARHDLPLTQCGCGLTGCFETYLAGPGLVKLAKLKTGQDFSTREIMSDPKLESVRAIWIDIAASLVAILTRTFDPEIIIFGGGLGSIVGFPDEVAKILLEKLLNGTKPPVLAQAQHGDASGALGAALFAKSRLSRASL
jgi:N-acetylglucosamine kinase